MRRAVTALLAFAALQATAAAAAAAANEVEFGVFGDAGYSLPEEMALERMIPEINRESLAFNVFVGDFKNGSSPCTDALFRERRTLFEKSRAPLVYIPGDNDWTDCHRAGAGGYDPMERLRKLRELFYPSRLSLGNGKLPLVSQRDMKGSVCPACVEHLRWRVGAVLFTTLNVPGSNNNLGRTPTMDAEHASRSKAVAGWLDATIAEAARAPTDALVIFFQANPFFERTEPGRPARKKPGGCQ